MAKKKPPKMVNCRYPKCRNLHETTQLLKSEATQGGKNSYYHPDCYNTMQTVNRIRDLFVKEINPQMVGRQIGALVSIVNSMIFTKEIEPEYILFALQYYIKYKPGKLHYPPGVTYIVQDKDVVAAWKKEKERKIKEELKEQMQKAVDQLGKTLDQDIELDFETEDSKFAYKRDKKSRFSSVLGV